MKPLIPVIILVSLILLGCSPDPLEEVSDSYPEEMTPSENTNITLDKIIPFQITFAATRPQVSHIIKVTSSEVSLQIIEQGELKNSSSMPLDEKALLKAIDGIPTDTFRGVVHYSNPFMRDGGTTQITTPLGRISEYGVIGKKSSMYEWPQAITCLEPLVALCGSWKQKLMEPEPVN